jgi:DNA topoisomerase-3
MAGSGSKFDRVYRAHFSAINPSDIKKAYNALGKPDRCQSLSVDARQELDLKVGVAFSRFQTRYFQGRYGDLDSAVLSYGPCQTPTLGFCVQRHLEMETFKPEPYWLLDLGIMNSGTMCRAVWDSGRSFNRNKVDGYIAKCRDANPASVAKVISVTTKDKNQGRPVPLNTVALLKACSKALGIGPHSALQIAERLYLSGYLSYPRTESTRYPKSFDIAGTLQDQLHDNRWGFYVRDLLNDGFNVAKGGVDAGDHPPITPCRHARAGELSGDMARVYDLVARHFIASVSHDAKWRSTTVKISIEELDEKGTFTIRGKTLISPGFLAIMLHNQYGDEREDDPFGEEEEEEKTLPEFQEGDLYGLFFSGSRKSGDKVSVAPAGKFCTLDIKEKMTTPPTYLTESELISRMEKHGIGTDASISTHIENILKRYYVELIPGRKLKPTKLGLVLAQGYHLIDDSLVLPKIRSDIEDQCNKIAKGLAERDEVVRKAIDLFSAKFTYFVDNVSKMDVLFGSSFARLQDVGKPFTRCGLTRRYLQFIAGPPPRLYNKTTESVYVLPIGGEIKQWTGRNCPVDGCNFELCLYSVGAPPRTFPLCPNCFNNPKPEWGPIPGEDTTPTPGDEEDENKERNIRRMAGKNMIRECPHPDKMPLIEEMTVSPDPESNGVLILDPHLGPKWRLVSTREPTIVHMPKSVERVTVLDTKDEVLGCRMMSIEFKEGESPLEGGKKKYTSCFANDEILQGLVRIHHGDERMKASSRGGRGRGRGGGRGGRGRGRGGRGRR